MIVPMRITKKWIILSLFCLTGFAFSYQAEAGIKKKPLTIVGAGKFGFEDGRNDRAELRLPYSAVIVKDKLYITDSGNHCIRELDLQTKVLRTFTGEAIRSKFPEEMMGYHDGILAEAKMNRPLGITVDERGVLYVADSGNHCIRVIKDGEISTFAGNGKEGYVDGKGENARFNTPSDLAFMNGDLYVSDSRNKAVRKIKPDGTVSTVLQGGDLLEPAGLFVKDDVLYITDSGAQAVFTYSVKDNIKLLTGGNTRMISNIGYRMIGNKDGKVQQAKYNFPKSVSSDGDSIYICDTWNSSIRKIHGKDVSTWMVLKNEKFLARPTKLLFTDKEMIIVDIINGQLLFYEK